MALLVIACDNYTYISIEERLNTTIKLHFIDKGNQYEGFQRVAEHFNTQIVRAGIPRAALIGYVKAMHLGWNFYL